MFYICDCGAKVFYDKPDNITCPQCRTPYLVTVPVDEPAIVDIDDSSVVHIAWTSAGGKVFEEVIGPGVDPDAVVGSFIRVGSTRFKVASYEVL